MVQNDPKNFFFLSKKTQNGPKNYFFSFSQQLKTIKDNFNGELGELGEYLVWSTDHTN